MRRPFLISTNLAIVLGSAVPAFCAGPDRPAGHVFDWGHELRQQRLPQWNDRTAPPIPPRRWYPMVEAMLRRAGSSGLWFSGYNGLPFDIPVHRKEPRDWRNPVVFGRAFRATGLSWDVNLEARAASRALARRTAGVTDATSDAPTRRLSLIDPGYERSSLAEIRRLVPRYASLPYVHAYTGSDEPVAVLPRGAAERSAFAARLRREVAGEFGWAPPRASTRPTRSVDEGLRWLAYSRYVSDRFFSMKERQARAIRALYPNAVIVPNDYVFLDGFMPWDYTRLGTFADIVEGDPYASLLDREQPGRGRYNHGFGAKFLSDLTGKPVRIIVQAFPYAGYSPTPDDVEEWTTQALRAGATHISFYALNNPRFTDPPLYRRMLDIARRVRGSRLPGPPSDPATVVVYATASEGQAQPDRVGLARYRTRADALYTTYVALGEQAHGAFMFDADTRIAAEPQRLARAKLVWLPRGETLDGAFAQRLTEWVRAGGTLVVTDPEAFTRTPDGDSLTTERDALIGAELAPTTTSTLRMPADALGPGLPSTPLQVVMDTRERHMFAAVPTDATTVATFSDGAAAVIVRRVGAGRVLAFATDPMTPDVANNGGELTGLVAAIQKSGGGVVEDPAWRYRIPQ